MTLQEVCEALFALSVVLIFISLAFLAAGLA